MFVYKKSVKLSLKVNGGYLVNFLKKLEINTWITFILKPQRPSFLPKKDRKQIMN